jgi:hypothetical protein
MAGPYTKNGPSKTNSEAIVFASTQHRCLSCCYWHSEAHFKRNLHKRGTLLQYRASKFQVPVWNGTSLQREKISVTWCSVVSRFHCTSGRFLLLKLIFPPYSQGLQTCILHMPLQLLQQGFSTYGSRPNCGSACTLGRVANINFQKLKFLLKCILVLGVMCCMC